MRVMTAGASILQRGPEAVGRAFRIEIWRAHNLGERDENVHLSRAGPRDGFMVDLPWLGRGL